jgi:hypothetical protein
MVYDDPEVFRGFQLKLSTERGMSAVPEVNWKAVVKYGLRSALGVAYEYVCILYFISLHSVTFYFEVPLVFMARSMFFQNKVVQKRFHFIMTSLNFGA